MKNFPAAGWAESQLPHPRTVKPVGSVSMRATSGGWGTCPGDLGIGPLGAFKGSHVPWFRIQLGRPGWEEMGPKATTVQTGGGISYSYSKPRGSFRGRESQVPEAEASLPKSDGVCFIPSTSFPNVYTT